MEVEFEKLAASFAGVVLDFDHGDFAVRHNFYLQLAVGVRPRRLREWVKDGWVSDQIHIR